MPDSLAEGAELFPNGDLYRALLGTPGTMWCRAFALQDGSRPPPKIPSGRSLGPLHETCLSICVMTASTTANLAIAGQLALAGLTGLAVGIEREWSGHASGPGARFAGIRTLTLLGLQAGIAGWLWSNGPHELAT